MGAVRAAVAVAAPETRALHGRASRTAGRRRPAATDPRVAAPGSTAARQREQIEAIKAARPAEDPPAPASPAPTSSGTGLTVPAIPGGAATATGSGFLLGVFGWALALAYLRGGPAGVRQFLAAKFLNKTT